MDHIYYTNKRAFTAALIPAAVAALASCAVQSDKVATPRPQAADAVQISEKPQTPKAPTPPKVMYQVFAGEIAGQHEDYARAAQHYLQAARLSEDPAVAQRATQIALFAGEMALASEAVARLLALSPERAQAHNTAALLALEEGDWERLYTHLNQMIVLSDDASAQTWQGIAVLLARSEQQDEALGVMERLVNRYPDNYIAHYGLSLLASHFQRPETAIEAVNRALALNDEWIEGYDWRGRLRLSTAEYERAAEDFERALELDPELTQSRYHYAEVLRRLDRFDDAQAVLEELPLGPDVLRTRAALAIEAENWKLAEELYRELLALEGYDPEARFFLGQLAEMQAQLESALDWYARVGGGEFVTEARVRQAVVLSELGRLDEALGLLDSMIAQGGDAAIEAWVTKGQLLAQNERIADAFDLYDKALAAKPNNTRLLYGRAILAAENAKVDLAESDFRRILEKQPDDAMALNALGYTLADETDRYQEALDLIQQALELEPDDAAIIDSLGWVQYRLGNYQAAEKHLRRALEMRFDAEVAAHLGEVLWVTGEREAAREIWQKALEEQPERSAVVHETMERLTP